MTNDKLPRSRELAFAPRNKAPIAKGLAPLPIAGRKPRRAHKVAISVDLIRGGFEPHAHYHTTGGARENWADQAKLVTSNNKSVTDVLTPPLLTPVSRLLTPRCW